VPGSVPRCSFDFNLPNGFDLYYTDRDGQRKRPYMVHRALLCSIERFFFGVLVEHYAGNFPLWAGAGAGSRAAESDEFKRVRTSGVAALKQKKYSGGA